MDFDILRTYLYKYRIRRRMREISPLLAGRRPQPLPVRDGRADERVGVVRPVGAVETERGLAADGGQSRSDGSSPTPMSRVLTVRPPPAALIRSCPWC